MELTAHNDGSLTITNKGTSCKVRGNVTTDGNGRQTVIVHSEDGKTLKEDFVIKDGAVNLFTAVSWRD